MAIDGEVWPEEVVLHEASGALALRWSDGLAARLPAPALREACKCAACENKRRAGRPPTASPGLALTGLNPIGDIGLQLVFNDGHDRGIYPWPYLHELSRASLSLENS